MSPQERKIEAALIDWFRREGFEIVNGFVCDNDGDMMIGIAALAQYLTDEINR